MHGLAFVPHQGEGAWRVSRQFADLVVVPEDLREELGRYQPQFEHALLDLRGLSWEELGGGVLLKAVLSLMKAVKERTTEEWLERVESLADERRPTSRG